MRMRPDRLPRVPWAAVAVFVVVSFGLAWLVALPLWLMHPDGAGYQALFSALASLMMFTPGLAVLVVVFAMKTPSRERMRFLGMWPLRPARRVVWFIVASLFAPVLLVIACAGVAVLCGWLTLDLVHFSAFREMLDAQLTTQGQSPELIPASLTGAIVLGQLLVIPFGALVNSVFAFGEEIGWRGWLLPALRPLGVWPALLASGAIWGLWHAPVILLGYNFGRTDAIGVLLMVGGCVMWGVFFGWLRLRSASVWPAVVGHGALNAAGGLVLLIGQAGAPLDMALVNPLGVSGWIVLAAAAVILLIARQFGQEPELAPKRVRSVPPPQAPPAFTGPDPANPAPTEP